MLRLFGTCAIQVWTVVKTGVGRFCQLRKRGGGGKGKTSKGIPSKGSRRVGTECSPSKRFAATGTDGGPWCRRVGIK